jgi:hypothetical protein
MPGTTSAKMRLALLAGHDDPKWQSPTLLLHEFRVSLSGDAAAGLKLLGDFGQYADDRLACHFAILGLCG